MNSLRLRTAPTHEKSAGAITAWHGPVSALIKEADSEGLAHRIRTFSQDTESDVSRALDVLRTITDIAVVVHGPAGCAGALQRHGLSASPWLVTDINERDSILGGDKKLRQAIEEAYTHYQPSAIVVVATPVVIINNDDIDSVTEELADELDIPVIPIFTDSFRSRSSVTGIDILSHGLLKHLSKRPRLPPSARSKKRIGLLSFSESAEDLVRIKYLISHFGLETVVFARHASWSELCGIANTALILSLQPSEASYAANAITDVFGVPHIHLPPPIGNANTTTWVRLLGEISSRPAAADALIESIRTDTGYDLQKQTLLRGKSVFINASPDTALTLWSVVQELGLNVAGIKVPYLDAAHFDTVGLIARQSPDTPLLVGDGQVFEENGLLRKTRPDLYLGTDTNALHALRFGIPSVSLAAVPHFGPPGQDNLARHLHRSLRSFSFLRTLSENDPEPYTAQWRQKSPGWYIKHEVK